MFEMLPMTSNKPELLFFDNKTLSQHLKIQKIRCKAELEHYGSLISLLGIPRIRMLLGLPDPDLFFRGMDPDQDADPSLFS